MAIWNKAMDKRKEADKKYKDLLNKKKREYNKAHIEKQAFFLRKEKEWKKYLQNLVLEEDKEIENDFIPHKYGYINKHKE